MHSNFRSPGSPESCDALGLVEPIRDATNNVRSGRHTIREERTQKLVAVHFS
jgi:hypothetical protein